MTAIFINGTGTAVGTTLVTASLIRHLRQLGHHVDAIKPIVSGYDPAQAAASDPALLLAALGFPFSAEAVAHISPWRFRAALSPDLAARREGRSIDLEQVVAFCQRVIDQGPDIVLIEGVGGIMVPLDEHRTILDVMMALRLPLILVGGSYPGSISHTLTALDALFRREMKVLATVVSETPGSTLPLDDVVATIARFTEPVIGVPRSRLEGGDSGAGAAFGRLFEPQGRRPQRGPQR